MEPTEARAWLDGFAAGAVFAGSNQATHKEMFKRLRREIREAQKASSDQKD